MLRITTSRRRVVVACVVLAPVVAYALLLLFLHPCLRTWLAEDKRYPSLDGRYELIYRSYKLRRSYSELWITDAGEQDSSKWFRLSPWVRDGWESEWTGDRELLLTDWCGTPRPKVEFGVTTWRDVRIEKRPRPIGDSVYSPNGRHRVGLWVQVDSRGRRMGAKLHHSRSPNCQLLHEGPWDIQATWLANDRVELHVTPHEGAVLPEVLTEWHGITIVVREAAPAR